MTKKLYCVYRNDRLELPVGIDLTRPEVAAVTGIALTALPSVLSAIRRGRPRSCQWIFYESVDGGKTYETVGDVPKKRQGMKIDYRVTKPDGTVLEGAPRELRKVLGLDESQWAYLRRCQGCWSGYKVERLEQA